MSRIGALLAARFSFMPNRLGYCGPEVIPEPARNRTFVTIPLPHSRGSATA